MFTSPELQQRLSGLRFGTPLHFFEQIDSTNTYAKQLADAGAPEGTLVFAEEQTAGRGRAGRTWVTPPGSALALSLVVRPHLEAAKFARLVMLAGVAACEALTEIAHLNAELKWPNDVLIDGKKVAGILVESALQGERLEYAVIGLGMNVSFFPTAVDYPATSVQAAAAHPIQRLDLLYAVLHHLEERYATLTHESLFTDWRTRLTMLGQTVQAKTDTEEFTAIAESVDADGALLLRLPSGEQRRLIAGEARLRPN